MSRLRDRGGARRGTRGARTPWWVTVLVAFVPAVLARALVGLELFNFEQLIAAVLALMALVLLVRNPVPALGALMLLVPFQLLLTSVVYELGASGGVTRMAALWKELVVLALAIAAWRRSRGHLHRIDPLDRMAIAFVALGTLYLLLPEIFVGEPGASLSMDARFVSWRFVVLPSVLLLACRRLRATPAEVRLVLRALTTTAAALGLVALAEVVVSDWWNRFVVSTIGVNRYRVEALDIDLTSLGLSAFDVRVYGEVAGREIVRVGGPMLSHLTFAFVLLIVLAVLLERVVRGASSWVLWFGLATCATGLLFTQTRSTIVGAVVLLAVALRPAEGRAPARRIRLAVLAGAVGVVALPLVLGAGLADRFIEGDQYSDSVHRVRVDTAFETVVRDPFGLGLGMGSTAGGRPAEGSVAVENQLLDTAVQLGVLGTALFVGQVLSLIVLLRRASARAGPSARTAAFAARGALLALLVPFWYQSAFSLIEVSWILFALAGTALGAAEADRDAPELPAGALVDVP